MMKLFFFSLFLFSLQANAGPPILNCAIPTDIAEVARQFSTYDHCLRYYSLRSGCDPRCIRIFEDLCHAATDQACPSLNLTPSKTELDFIY